MVLNMLPQPSLRALWLSTLMHLTKENRSRQCCQRSSGRLSLNHTEVRFTIPSKAILPRFPHHPGLLWAPGTRQVLSCPGPMPMLPVTTLPFSSSPAFQNACLTTLCGAQNLDIFFSNLAHFFRCTYHTVSLCACTSLLDTKPVLYCPLSWDLHWWFPSLWLLGKFSQWERMREEDQRPRVYWSGFFLLGYRYFSTWD